MTDTPHSLIERLLGADESEAEKDPARLVAELSARLSGKGKPSEATPEIVAARLDGYRDGERQGEADAVFAVSPEALYDLESAAAFLDTVEANSMTAPADVVAAAIGSREPIRAATPPAQRSWRWRLVGAGIGLALAALTAVLIMTQQARPVDPKALLIAKPEAPADAPKLAQPKAKERPAMMPAGSEDAVSVKKPVQGGEEALPATRPGMPRLAPESPEVMPGR